MCDVRPCVAECVARQQFTAAHDDPSWDQLSRRTRSRFMNRAKRWLNTVAVEHLSLELLAESDPGNEVLHWLRTASELMSIATTC